MLEKVKQHFLGKALSAGRVNVKGFGKILVDFAEIRIQSYNDITPETLREVAENHDCFVEVVGVNVYRIVPNLVKNITTFYILTMRNFKLNYPSGLMNTS